MFELTGTERDAELIASADPEELARATSPLVKEQRALVARTILAATRIAEVAFAKAARNLIRQGRLINSTPEKAAVREVSWRFAVSRSIAGQWISLGQDLRLLPLVTAAFLRGELSEYRARIVAGRLAAVNNDAVRDDAQEPALELAAQPTSGPVLAERLDALLIALDPEGAASDRDLVSGTLDVTFAKESHGHWNISATVPLEDGLYLKARITGMLKHCLCKHDPRSIGQQRVAALRAIMHNCFEIDCECGDSDCPAPANQGDASAPIDDSDPSDVGRSVVPSAPAVPGTALVQVITEPKTLSAALVVRPTMVPYIPGYGPVDPAFTRDLVARPGTSLQRLTCGPSGLAAGRPARPKKIPPTGCAVRPIRRTPKPTSVVPIDPSGHGGHAVPPPGALDYAPSAALRRLIERTDHYCRGPQCSVPVARCQLDHTIPFDHANPLAGGWTLPENIEPLCLGCHQFKHLGIWVPVMHSGRIIVWTHAETGETIVSYPDEY